jgi:hypothetical protein
MNREGGRRRSRGRRSRRRRRRRGRGFGFVSVVFSICLYAPGNLVPNEKILNPLPLISKGL